MTCRALHNRVQAKCAILLKDEQKALSFAKIACSFVIMFPHSKGLANTFCIELAFDPRLLDRVTTNNLCQAFLSLPYLAEFNIQFPMGSARAWRKLTRLIPTDIIRIRLKNCFLAVCLSISAAYIYNEDLVPFSIHLDSPILKAYFPAGI